jgi:heme oxygenase
MSLSVQLREVTRPAHEQMEKTLNLLRPRFGREELAHLLGRWYGFIAVWEPASFATFGPAMQDYLSARRKLPMLNDDLAKLAMDPATLPRIDPTPLGWTDPSRALGTLYVLEGSTLGGQVIVKKVREQFGIESAYFSGYGHDTGARWQETRRLLDAPPFPVDPPIVTDAASQSFAFLAGWLARNP